MLKVKFIVLGTPTEKFFSEACQEYKKRLGSHCKVNEVQLKESYLPQNPSSGEIKTALDDEANRILQETSPRAVKIALCIEGKEMDSPSLAKYIEDKMISGFDEIDFIIGSSHGLSDKIKSTANLCFSMSKLTFPHSLARVMLYETVYRAFEINKGSKYHK